MDWSLGNFADKAKGLMDPTAQKQLLANPMFSSGMGLLAASQDGNINPFTAAMQGLEGAKKQGVFDEDRARIAELRKKLAALLMQQQGGPQMGPPAPQNALGWQQLPTPGGQQPPSAAPMGPPPGLMMGP